VEFLSVVVLEETTHSPGVGVHEVLVEEVLLNGFLLFDVLLEYSSEEVEHLVDSDNLGLRHHIGVLFGSHVESVNLFVLDVLLCELVHPVSFLLVGVALNLLSVSAPGIDEWSPAEISGRYVDDSASGHSGWGSIVQVLDLEDHFAVIGHWNTLSIGEGENLVVIEHSVQVLNPNGIDWSIANNPGGVFVSPVIALLPDLRVDAWHPLTGHSVHHTVHLWTSDSLWIHDVESVWLIQLSQSIGQGVHNGCLTAADGTNHHETVTHKRCFVKLNDLDEP